MLSSNTPTSELKVSKQNKLFTELSLAIACNKTSEIDQALQTTPDIFLQRDNLGNTLLHYAVMQGNLDSIKKITEFLVESKKINQITDTQNCTNDTLLHLATEFGNYSIVQYLKLTLSSQTVEMSGILNKRGKLPLHLIEENTTASEHQSLERILLRISRDYRYKRISDSIKITAESKENKSLEANLKLVCEAVNKAHNRIKTLINHPHYNSCTQNEKNLIQRSCEKQQKELKSYISMLDDETEQNRREYLAIIAAIIEKNKIATSSEMNYLTANYLVNNKEAQQTVIEYITIKNSDQIYIVIGRKQDSHTEDPKSYGEDAVICDAQTGEVFPATEFYSKKIVSIQYQSNTNNYYFLAYPHPEVHTINKNIILMKVIDKQVELDLLENAMDALSERDCNKIKLILESTPTITLVRDELNLSLIDYTVMNGNLEIVKLVLEHIEKNKQLDRLINIKNYTEDTLLHIASKFNTSDIIELLIKKLGVKAKTMIETSNKSGETPLSLLSNLPLTERVKANAAVLIPYSIEPKSNLLSKTIDENNCLKLYPEASKNLKLATNIKSCCTAFNKSSKHVRSSDTNAEYNYISYEEKNITAKKITTLREHYTPYFLQFYHHQQPSMKMLEPIIAYIEEFEGGNCLESCLWIFKFLSQCTELQKSSIELIRFTNADHVFVVLDRSPYSNISNPVTWGDTSVVCDGLTGKVFPAKYFDTQKMYYYNYQHGSVNYNITALPNLKYHRLDSLISLSNDGMISTNKNALFTKNNCNTTEMTSQQTITIESSKQGLKS